MPARRFQSTNSSGSVKRFPSSLEWSIAMRPNDFGLTPLERAGRFDIAMHTTPNLGPSRLSSANRQVCIAAPRGALYTVKC